MWCCRWGRVFSPALNVPPTGDRRGIIAEFLAVHRAVPRGSPPFRLMSTTVSYLWNKEMIKVLYIKGNQICLLWKAPLSLPRCSKMGSGGNPRRNVCGFTGDWDVRGRTGYADETCACQPSAANETAVNSGSFPDGQECKVVRYILNWQFPTLTRCKLKGSQQLQVIAS